MPLPKVWVYAEGEDGKATSATLELLTKARDIGDTLTIIIVENTSAKEDRNTSTSQEVDWSGKITRLMYPNILRHQRVKKKHRRFWTHLKDFRLLSRFLEVFFVRIFSYEKDAAMSEPHTLCVG